MSARQARLALADSRALEEEAERYNPVNPKHQIGSRRGRTSLVHSGDEYSGGGATPSMGLSQFRGGSIQGCGEDGEELVGCGVQTRMVGAGRKKKGKSEAYEMGHHLGKHLHSLHGAGFWDDFKSGFNAVVSPVAGIAKAVLPLAGPEGMAASGVIGALGYGKKGRKGKGKLVIHHGSGLLGEDGHGTYKGKALLGQDGHGTYKGKALLGQDGHGTYKGRGNTSGPGYEAVSGLGYSGAGILDDIGEISPVFGDLVKAFGGKKPKRGKGFLSDMLGSIPLVGGPLSSLTGAIGLGKKKGRKMKGGVTNKQISDFGESVMNAFHIPHFGIGSGSTGAGATGAGATGAGVLSDFGTFVKQGSQVYSALQDMPDESADLISKLTNMPKPFVSQLMDKYVPKKGSGKNGRSARAEVVKRVMRERGVKMIEASKIVKAEGLY